MLSLMAEERRTHRFAIRRDSTAWSVYEVWTGEAAVIALVPQTGLSEEDAQHTADLLNRRARGGDRSRRQ
jgi:hypothetical protein